MNADIFNELMDRLGAVQLTFRSPETFQIRTRTLFETVLSIIAKLKVEQPALNREERDAVLDLEERLRAYQRSPVSSSKDLVDARQVFRNSVLVTFLKVLDEACAQNPKYGIWLRKLTGYKLLRKLVGA